MISELLSFDREFTPIPSFYFVVEVDGEKIQFQEVSGLESTLELEEIIEGGNNEYKLRLPLRVSYKNLTLARGVARKSDLFYNWVKDLLLNQNVLDQSFFFKSKKIKIDLISPSKGEKIVRSWSIENAFPVRWSISNFNSMENKIAIETVEFAFDYLQSND